MNGNSWAGELYRQRSSLLVCVCVCACVRFRRSCNQSGLSGDSLCRAHCCPLLLSHWPLFSFTLPSALSFFSSATRPAGFFSPGSLGYCGTALSWLAGRHCKERSEQEAGGNERERSWDRLIDYSDTEESHRESRGSCSIFPCRCGLTGDILWLVLECTEAFVSQFFLGNKGPLLVGTNFDESRTLLLFLLHIKTLEEDPF